MFTDDTLAGKVILVTGGGSGLGLSMATHFASVGASVAICGRTEEKLINAAAGIFEKTGSEVFTWPADVRNYDEVGAMFDALWKKFGIVNGLVNNAAGNFLSASEDISPNGFKAVVDIVLHGTFNCTQQFGKRLISKKKPGTILNIVTTYTETGSAFVLPSACAKAGVYAMTNTLAYEWAEYNIRVNSVAPGPFPTEGAFSRLMPKKLEKAYLKKIPARRFGEHEELASLVTFMMSDMAPYITGECVTIDGGERLRAGQFNILAESMPRMVLKGLFKMMR